MERRGNVDWLEAGRRAFQVLLGLWLAAYLLRGINWVTGLEGLGLLPVALVLLPLGAVAGWRWARDLKPLTERERRDTAIGWSVVGALVGTIAFGVLAGVFE